MTGLVAVARHLPPTVAVTDLRETLGLDDRQVRRFTRLYGLDRICRAPGGSEADLLVAAAGELVETYRDRIRYVVRAKGTRTTAPYPHDPLARTCERLGLGGVPRLGVADHGCATGLLALDAAATLVAADPEPDALALVLAGDRTFTPFTRWVEDVSIMGEGTAAALVGTEGVSDRMLGYASRIHGRADGVIDMDAEAAREAMRIYQDATAEVVAGALKAADLTIDDIALILPHNVNRVSWTVAADRLGVDVDRIYLDGIARTGHCFCADPLINREDAVADGRLLPGDRYLMTSAGLGQSFAAMVLDHHGTGDTSDER